MIESGQEIPNAIIMLASNMSDMCMAQSKYGPPKMVARMLNRQTVII